MKLIFEFPTIENLRIDIIHDICGSLGLKTPFRPPKLPPPEGALAGVGVPQNKNEGHF